jgi:RHS repeat-associated protein
VKKLWGSKYATTFTYDPQGRLLKRIKKDGTELMYYYHGLTPYLVKKKSGANWVTHQTYTLAPGALGHIMHVRTIDGSNVDRYYHYDRLGNVMNVTDENGLALVNYVQEGFGNVLLTQEDFARLEIHSPIAAYDLPEGSGSSTNDRTSGNNDGTISGASWSTGEFTYGLNFDGTDDKVSFSSVPDIEDSFSVAAWVKIDSQSGFHPVVTNFTPGMDVELKGWRLGVSGGKVCLQLYDQWEEPYEALGTTTLSTSKWYLIAATYNSSTGAMKVYVNGTDDTSGSPTGQYTASGNFGIGWDGVAHQLTQYYDGLIDSVAVYDTALSATQVKQLWDSGDKSGYHLTTKEYDPDTGLYYFWQRWYDASNARFTQQDLFINSVRLKQYVYCENNPMVFIDVTGKNVWVCYRPSGGILGWIGRIFGVNSDHCYICLAGYNEDCYSQVGTEGSQKGHVGREPDPSGECSEFETTPTQDACVRLHIDLCRESGTCTWGPGMTCQYLIRWLLDTCGIKYRYKCSK